MTPLETTDRLASAIVRMRALILALDGAAAGSIDEDAGAGAIDWLAHEALHYLEELAEEFEEDRQNELASEAALQQ